MAMRDEFDFLEEETPMTDEEISDYIEAAYGDDERIEASNIDVFVENGRVTLEGSVATEEEKEMAETLLDDIGGITTVENNLQVILSDYNAPLEFPGVEAEEEEFEGVEVVESDEKLVTEDIQEAIEDGKSYVPPTAPSFPEERDHARVIDREEEEDEEYREGRRGQQL